MSATSPLRQLQRMNHPTSYEYQCPPSGFSRSPCPALNTLANHGYIRREGTDLKFLEVVRAIVLVYNFSYPLAVGLALMGFATCGKISFDNGILSSFPPANDHHSRISLARKFILFLVSIINSIMCLAPSFTLDLSGLSERGRYKIAHDASFAHPNGKPSTSPDPTLLKGLLQYALSTKNPDGSGKNGLGLVDLAAYHALRRRSAAPLDTLHAQIDSGECSLTWKMLASEPGEPNRSSLDGVIPVSRLEQWFGEERLPDGWWDVNGVRPLHTVGLVKARMLANFIEKLSR